MINGIDVSIYSHTYLKELICIPLAVPYWCEINIAIHALLSTCATDPVFPDRSILARVAMTDGTNANARMQLLILFLHLLLLHLLLLFLIHLLLFLLLLLFPFPHLHTDIDIASFCYGHKNTFRIVVRIFPACFSTFMKIGWTFWADDDSDKSRIKTIWYVLSRVERFFFYCFSHLSSFPFSIEYKEYIQNGCQNLSSLFQHYETIWHVLSQVEWFQQQYGWNV